MTHRAEPQSVAARRERILRVISAVTVAVVACALGVNLVVAPVLLLSMLSLGWLEATRKTPGWIDRVVNGRVIRFASDTSYGVYLFHGVCISASGWPISGNRTLLSLAPPQRVVFMLIFVTALVYPLAHVVYQRIELPGIRFGKRVIEKTAP